MNRDSLWTFEWAVTDRRHWPSLIGAVTVLAGDYFEAFDIAHEMVAISTRAAMVIELECVSWPMC